MEVDHDLYNRDLYNRYQFKLLGRGNLSQRMSVTGTQRDSYLIAKQLKYSQAALTVQIYRVKRRGKFPVQF